MGLFEDVVNIAMDIEARSYDRGMQQQAWRREDTAVQRRAADLRAAGLSPVLAAGSAAQSSSPIRATVPRWEGSSGDKAVLAAQLMKQNADISMTNAQKGVVQEQKKKLAFENQALDYLKSGSLSFSDPITGREGLNVFEFLGRSAAKRMLLDMNNAEMANETIRANRDTALANAALINRQLLFDVEHSIFSEEARAAQAMSTWLNEAGIDDLSGPAINGLWGLLEKMVPSFGFSGRLGGK